MGYASTYRRYSVLELRAGALVAERKLNRKEYEAFRQSQFEKFKQTNAYKDLMKESAYEERFIFEFSFGSLHDHDIRRWTCYISALTREVNVH